jgi:hypothetical protein
MEKIQKPSNSVCYTPSSEVFRIYLNFLVHLCLNSKDLLPRNPTPECGANMATVLCFLCRTCEQQAAGCNCSVCLQYTQRTSLMCLQFECRLAVTVLLARHLSKGSEKGDYELQSEELASGLRSESGTSTYETKIPS